MQKINVKLLITDIHGNPGKKSFPKNEADAANMETLDNVLLNSLAIFPIRERKDIFYVQVMASKILQAPEKGDIEITDIEKNFLGQVLFEATHRREGEGDKQQGKGVYLAIVISQAMQAIGLNN